MTGAAALLMVFVAQYKLWSKEREEREVEQAKNQRPELKGEAHSFEAHGMQGEGLSDGDWHCNTQFRFKVNLCNHRPVNTNITEIRLDGSPLNPPVVFGECEIPRDAPLGAPPDLQLNHGIAKSFAVNADATINGMRSHDVKDVDLQNLRIVVVDGDGISAVVGG